ncbi:hypothetical protein ACQPU1_09000 [Clostridium paraputrificum]|uniref:hypothetical protein n=1 Tax=Clostridium paraputrificum TaxID=29363 RepID=UPI003D33288C
MKINMYVDKKKRSNKNINIEVLKNNFIDYERWLDKTKRPDGIENYKLFLRKN